MNRIRRLILALRQSRSKPVPGEVLVKVEALSFSSVEQYIRQGYLHQTAPLELPAILGLDLAGTVAPAHSHLRRCIEHGAVDVDDIFRLH